MGVLDDLDASQRAARTNSGTRASTGSNTKTPTAVKNTAAATVKAASPTTAVRADTRDPTDMASALASMNKSNKGVSGGGADKVDKTSAMNWSQFQDFADSGTPSRGGADKVDRTPSMNWSQFQDFADSGTPMYGRPGRRTDTVGGLLGGHADLSAPLDVAPAQQGNLLQQLHDFLQGPYQRRVEANGGVAPFEGPIDSAGIESALQEPYRRRVLPLGLGVSGGGLADAMSPSIPGPDAVTKDVAQLPVETPLTSNVAPSTTDPRITAYDVTPSGEIIAPALAGIDAAVTAPPSTAPTAAEQAWSDRVFGGDTSGANDPLFSTDGQVQTPDGVMVRPGVPVAANDAPTNPPSKWDNVVDNTGKLLSHTGLGGLVSTLFPDLWGGMGDAFKGIGGATTKYPDDMATAVAGMYGDPHHNRPQQLQGFVDLNHNGIDDRLEGYKGPDTNRGGGSGSASGGGNGSVGGNQFRSNRTAVFPDMPPYQPGVDDEWNYFHDHLARGGVVGYAERDPRVTMIADAEDALHRGDHQHPSITKFVDAFGPKALEHLNNNVLEGHRMRAGRTIVGPGGPTDDAVPAVIDGQHPAKLSSGEFVVPVAAVEGIGGGDPKVGADRLHDLVSRFAAK